jgi:uncharacterized membrane protein
MQASDFFNADDRRRIELAIREAELNTSGEIRVHVETSYSGELLDRAATVFSRLGMHKTTLRNGVLFYIAVNKRQFAVIGDSGINLVVPGNFWDEIKSVMEICFRNSQFAEGLSKGIVMAGEQMKKHFPHRLDDQDELPNDISIGEDTKS